MFLWMIFSGFNLFLDVFYSWRKSPRQYVNIWGGGGNYTNYFVTINIEYLYIVFD